MQQIGGQEDAATEAHQQAEDSLAAVTLAFDPSCHAVWYHGEYEWQNERQDQANQFRHPTIHLCNISIRLRMPTTKKANLFL